MGRSRGIFQSTDEDPSQRSRRKKNATSVDLLESAISGHGAGEGKKALYHCNYCNTDITGKIRIKCAVCSDFDLCIGCLSVGAEITPHKSNHPYRVMDNLSFPLICPDWNADDEILLLEGIEMYGFGNWAEVVEHVGTKTKEQCIEHYTNVYLNSPYFPLPDMSHVVGKNRKDLLAMAKGQGFSLLGELTLKEETPFSPSRIKYEDSNKSGPITRLLSSSNAEVDSGPRTSAMSRATSASVNKASNVSHIESLDTIKMEDRGFKGKKPSSSGSEGSFLELNGYNAKRREFDPEYDNDAELLLAEMEFKDADTEEERELKLRVLHIYSKRLDERKRRKDFILERKLLNPNPILADFSPEERGICRRYDIFMRFHSMEEHNELIQSIVAEHRIRARIQELKDARSAGCRSSAEADRYLEQKRKKRKDEECVRKEFDSAQIKPNNHGEASVCVDSESLGFEINLGQQPPSLVNEVDTIEFPGVDLLSDTEKRLCRDIKLLPAHYLRMQEIISIEIFNGKVSQKSDAHCLFKLEPSKVDKVYEMLIRKGISP